ncbi:MAG: hypothetical protein LC790_20420 [Actinobacteria bacterium]|nr:hypothetical protein [Actinomycetota bacterium]
MTAAHPAGSPAARLTDIISAARTACPGQPDRAERREPRSGALDRPPQRSYPYQHQPTARPARCGLIDHRICGDNSDTPHFPTLAWLERHGPSGLAAAVTHTGGGAHWASVLHMPPPAPARWTDERIEAELRRICHNLERWPTRDEFRAAGAQGLLRAIYSGHGSRWWAQRLGLSTHTLRIRRR